MPKIIVLETNRATGGELAHTLSRAGFDSLIASTGSQAVARLEEDPSIRLVLIDLDGQGGPRISTTSHGSWGAPDRL